MTFHGTGTARTDAARLYVDRAATLSERIAVKPGPGREKAHCDALLAEMRRSELLAVCVPRRLGGPELDVAAIAAITHEIARQSGSAGLVYAMHMSQALSLSVHAAATPWFDALQRRMLADQLLIASGTSEKGPGGDILTSLCSIEPDGEDRLKVVKESPNISYVDHADMILVTANRIGAGGRKKQVLIAADLDRTAFQMGRDMSLMGMRGILNGPWTFTIRFAPEAILAADFGAIARQTMTPAIHIFWSALWSGIVWTALDRTRRFVTAETDPAGATGQLALYELTRLIDRHHMMNALIRQAIAAYEAREQAADMGFGLSAQINRLKVNCSELAVAICVGALGLVGLRGYATAGPYSLAEPLADILSGPIMVSNHRLSMNTAKIERFVDERLA